MMVTMPEWVKPEERAVEFKVQFHSEHLIEIVKLEILNLKIGDQCIWCIAIGFMGVHR